MSKQIQGKVSFESIDFLIVFDLKPEMEDTVSVPLYGNGKVTGLNNNYKGTDQTWIMVNWNDGRTSQFQYVL